VEGDGSGGKRGKAVSSRVNFFPWAAIVVRRTSVSGRRPEAVEPSGEDNSCYEPITVILLSSGSVSNYLSPFLRFLLLLSVPSFPSATMSVPFSEAAHSEGLLPWLVRALPHFLFPFLFLRPWFLLLRSQMGRKRPPPPPVSPSWVSWPSASRVTLFYLKLKENISENPAFFIEISLQIPTSDIRHIPQKVFFPFLLHFWP
jgi:hypothetical protein